MTDREQINSLTKKVFDYANEIVALKQENNELKKRVAELEKPKKKRKFRAMTIGEYCTGKKKKCEGCEYNRNWWYCSYSNLNKVNQERDKNKPYKTRDGKYILREVKE